MVSEATSLDQSSRIDHFSSLPNELLDYIFDYAYESSGPQGPISKHLLPFFEQQLYRKVSLWSFSLPHFLDIVAQKPRLGKVTLSLALPANGDRRLQELLPLLPNLVDVDLPSLPPLPLSSSQTTLTNSTLSRLRRIAVSLGHAGDSANIDDLSQLATLHSLRQLKVYHFNTSGMSGYRSAITPLSQITQLNIEGVAADLEPVKFVLNVCPSVLHLELYSTYQTSAEFDSSLPHIPATLHSLYLRSDASSATRFDHLLSRFSQLRSIRLGDRCYSSTIHSALLQLPLLTRIHLGCGPLDPVGFRFLVTGPTRLLSLQTITLDFYTSQEGKRSHRPYEIICGNNGNFKGLGIEMSDWEFPDEWEGACLDVGAYKESERLSKENGVVIDGTIKVALDWCRNYHFESNNRAVIDAYHRQDFTHLRQIYSSAAQAGIALPNVAFHSLDTNRLEIVEIDLPEHDWWMLSLRDKE
ncbi:hypothetical protein JCM5353_002128 [Sporobolomyces roseus]